MTVSSPSVATRGADPSLDRTQLNKGLLLLFVVMLLIPISFEIASIRFSPDRLFLLICTVPFFIKIVSGQIGRFTTVDLFFLLHGVWVFVAMVVNHGVARLPFAGITAVELIGGYFAGRVLITGPEQYKRLFIIILVALLFLLPFVLVESVTGKMVIPDLMRPIFETPFRARSAYGRMGLERVYGVFYHPILWGLFCALTLANFAMIWRKSRFSMVLLMGFALFTTFLSLSSGPLLACAVQLMLLAWGWMMGGRWKLLLILSVVGYVVIDLLSNRTPVTILIDTMTFNATTGWTRIAIFDYGWAAVQSSPIFGIGFNDWPRPDWLTSSVDNFWLLTAMRYGLVGAFFIVAAFATHFWRLFEAKISDPDVSAIRIGHGVALTALAFTMVTVHIWGALAVFAMFYVGSGAWIYVLDHSSADQGSKSGSTSPSRAIRYTRFHPNVRPTKERAPV